MIRWFSGSFALRKRLATESKFGEAESNRQSLLQRQAACACGSPIGFSQPKKSTGSWNRTNGSLSNNQAETPTSPLRYFNSEVGRQFAQPPLRPPNSDLRPVKVVRVRFELTDTGF